MAERQLAKTATQQPAKSRSRKTSNGFTAEERAAMRERAREAKAESRGGQTDGESEVLAKIAEMQQADRVMAERIHAIVTASGSDVAPRTWYGMPAYAKDGKVVCYFKPAEKFKSRYATLGFSDKANLDEGDFWPVEFAVKKLSADAEARMGELVKRAMG